ncbi:MAG: hypothetical protein IV097_18285 [Burkholderiaceae bacterium]|nr:hypothetical protein [Burkholderiaceae bacterium]
MFGLSGSAIQRSRPRVRQGTAGYPGRWQQGAINYGTTTVTTPMGKKPTESTLKRFFVGPANNEITGICETPDGWVMITKNDGGRIGS